ncbi:MAG: leucyl/phenylalanyl-tRNA--protein transferase [Acidobacteriota bacterium]
MVEILFPDPRLADEHGLVAVGGDFRPETLLSAYATGIFPWPSDDLVYAWVSPDPRLILSPSDMRVSKSLAKTLRRGALRITFDTAFEAVVEACAQAERPDQNGTWIVEELRAGFSELHRQGLAHSVETWLDDELVGGLYGLSLGAMFCGESMFHAVTDASKVALFALARQLEAWSFHFIDCQVPTPHLLSLGARRVPRDEYLDALSVALDVPTRRGSWRGSIV